MDVQYYALFLSEESSLRLLDFLTEDAPDELYEAINNFADKTTLHLHPCTLHCTLLHKSQYNNNKNIYRDIITLQKIINPNKLIPLFVDELGWSDKAIAFKCKGDIINLNAICANKIPHITAYTINNGKPVDSNYITHWIPITPITVFAKLDCIL
jgi:hypothetical protein